MRSRNYRRPQLRRPQKNLIDMIRSYMNAGRAPQQDASFFLHFRATCVKTSARSTFVVRALHVSWHVR